MTAAEDAAAALAAGEDVAASELELATATALVNAINPKTPIRWGAKRFKAATTPLAEEKRLSIKVENAVKVISHFKHEAQLNSWQDAVTINVGTLAVPIIKDIFDHHRDITLDQLKDNAWKSFGNDPAVVRIKTDPLNAKMLDPNTNLAHETIFYSRVMLELIGPVRSSLDTLIRIRWILCHYRKSITSGFRLIL
eukprot:scaffold28313_cov46-Attheya_sp.AAC.2